jgi:DNA-binding NtrC family response regulator
MASLLVVDDQRSARAFLEVLLSQEGHEVATAANGAEALSVLEQGEFELVLSDLDMPEMDGFELLHRIRERWGDLPVVVVTAVDEVEKIVEAVQLGASDYLVKPAAPPAVLNTVRRALAARRSARPAPRTIPELVGATPAMAEVRRLVTLAAGSSVPVLITGDTGCGKELVARAIHRYSALSDGPFVSHNCAVMPRDLFESVFFGHRRGSFTGADRDHPGLLVQADGGLLFLDEVQTLLPAFQAKLLRVLDDGEVLAIGSERPVLVSVRFLAATNRDPREMIEEGELRADLYYRLRGFEISLPPLEARRDDIPLLAAHFLGAAAPGFTPDAIEALVRAPWPGNVRQLRHVVLSAAAAAGSERIGRRHLSLDPGAPAARTPGSGEQALRGTLRDVERRAIVQALSDHEQNRSAAARALGIDRSTLRPRHRPLHPAPQDARVRHPGRLGVGSPTQHPGQRRTAEPPVRRAGSSRQRLIWLCAALLVAVGALHYYWVGPGTGAFGHFETDLSGARVSRYHALSGVERRRLQEQRELVRELARRHVGSPTTGRSLEDLRLIQTIVERADLERDQTWELQALGVALGIDRSTLRRKMREYDIQDA